MRVESSFEVPADRQEAWRLLLDVPRVVPCMPGATLVEEVDGDTWKATMAVKLGPISLTFASDVHREEADEEAGRVRLSVDAKETRGRGAARVGIESALRDVAGGTGVDVVADLTLSGSVAQYGRGIVQDVTSQLVARFAECLRAQLAEGAAEPALDGGVRASPAAAAPVSGGRLLLRALVNRLRAVLRRGGEARSAE